MKLGQTVVLLTHHKCASTWLRWLAFEICRLNDIDFHGSHLGTSTPIDNSGFSLLQNADPTTLSACRISNAIHFIRDPMSIVLSAYYSHLHTHPLDDWPQLQRQRKDLLGCDVSEGLTRTYDFLTSDDFSPGTRGPLVCLRSWDYDLEGVRTVRMEDAVRHPGAFISALNDHTAAPGLTLPSGDQFVFRTFTGREIGDVDDRSHYRSGDRDAWRPVLGRELKDRIRTDLKDYLLRFYPESLSG